MLRELYHHAVPSFLQGGKTAYPLLNTIASELTEPGQIPGSVLEKHKPELFALLRQRFPETEAQALTLKALNLLLAQHQFRNRSIAVQSRPFGLVIDPSNMCQLSCPGCVHSERNESAGVFDWPNGTLPPDCIATLLRQYGPYAVGAYFCNYGEPLLNLSTPKFISKAKSYLLGTGLSTSLSVKKFDAEAYVESGLDFMVVSLDGATQPVYERFRRGGNLELALNNLRRLVEAKHKLRSETPVISWNFLAFTHNAHEIPAAERLARKIGVNLFRVVNPFDVTWDDPEIQPAIGVKGYVRRLDLALHGYWHPSGEALNAEAIGQAFAESWAPSGESTEEPAAGSGHTCHWLYKNVVLDATGRIMPCCGAPKPGSNHVFANIQTGLGDPVNLNDPTTATTKPGPSDPFNSVRYQQAREFFVTGEAGEDAPYCTRCDWDQTTINIGAPEIRRYFRAVDPLFFDRRSVDLLSQ